MSRPNSFYSLETIGGILLFAAAILAIAVANSPLREAYTQFLYLPVDVNVGQFGIHKPLLDWVNDGLMAIYFLVVGLEIKREINRGILSSKTSIAVPAVTAFCGLVVPALIFILFNLNEPSALKGWAIPSATDIAFTLGIISFLNNRVPFSLKILLTAIAIFDDMGAIAIIAAFFTQKLSLISLSLAGIFTTLLILFNYFNCRRISLYMVVGVALWAAVLKSGVHATLAGIIIAMTIPDKQSHSLLAQLENALHPWAAFFILPVFAFANAGVTFIGFDFHMFLHPIVLGIALGLFVGKQTGIFLPLWYFFKKKKFLVAQGVELYQIYGISLICGVGFTMSLFIGSLAYQQQGPEIMGLVKIGVLTGSILSALFGTLVLTKAMQNGYKMLAVKLLRK